MGGTQPGSEGLWGLLITSVTFNMIRRANTSSLGILTLQPEPFFSK